MPHPILRHENQENKLRVSLIQNYQTDNKLELTLKEKQRINQLLRKKRSKEYMKSISTLDAGGHTNNQDQIDKIIDSIENEFDEVEISKILIGIIARCHLGNPYEVHTLSLAPQIIKHYKIGESLPFGMEKARTLVMRGNYEYVEVYTDCFRAVNRNGEVSVIKSAG